MIRSQDVLELTTAQSTVSLSASSKLYKSCTILSISQSCDASCRSITVCSCSVLAFEKSVQSEIIRLTAATMSLCSFKELFVSTVNQPDREATAIFDKDLLVEPLEFIKILFTMVVSHHLTVHNAEQVFKFVSVLGK
jgi:hypothetical protein